jgi:hypothetical protein
VFLYQIEEIENERTKEVNDSIYQLAKNGDVDAIALLRQYIFSAMSSYKEDNWYEYEEDNRNDDFK